MGGLVGDECGAREIRALVESGARVIRGDITAAQERCRIAIARSPAPGNYAARP